MKIGVSSGSLEVLKRKIFKKDSPTTLYLLIGSKCLNNCAFCIQARNVRKETIMLSRISWPPIDLEELETLLSEFNPFKRICLQVTNHLGWKANIVKLTNAFKKYNLPISISAPVEDLEDVNFLFKNGVDRINISIDAAEKELYEKIKGKNWKEKIDLIREASKIFPKKITTHIIVGLGEKEKSLVELIKDLSCWEVKVALFAFTPLPGTPLENLSQPSYLKYRKIQIVTYLLQNHLIDSEDLTFDKDELILTKKILEKAYLYFHEIFKTSGCPYCNRPYYNESPRIIPYNYPRDLTKEEIEEIKLTLEDG
ncbi:MULTISPECIES: radical SAM protein [Dictyoglomus]|uniref:Radical SAM domain protein n=1 Tax=Dictyoglomus turgidum (strain DSM 6724 / Z-1310) TaxID=515635 RepID=B8E2F0_DICTD|nr:MULTISPECIES: radical SAM protein [Dictyoglomus]ACK42794.1 Radical SAM domain protein [Dictyoglomus turgidum DSM 6724]HBU30853.1 radical SAM protein [Dictyoglomus sp.]